MRFGVVVFSILIAFISNGQIHNRVLKFSSGVTYDQFAHQNLFASINDTSDYKFEQVTVMPLFAYSHEVVLSNVISFSGRIGFQYMNEYYNHQYFGSPLVYGSANLHASLIYRRGFEYYVKLQAGVACWFQHTELLNDQYKRYFPDKVSLMTGVTLVGLNFFLTDHLGLNLELNIWSPEMATMGVTYRYWKGELPEIQETKEL